MLKEKEDYLKCFLEEINKKNNLSLLENNSSQKDKDFDLSNISLFKIKEITYEEEEKMPRKEAFENVLGTIREEGINFIYLILGNKKGVSFYFGVVKDLNSDKEPRMTINEMGEKLLSSAISGNFRGSKVEKLKPQTTKEILKQLGESKRFGSIIGTPGINESSDNNNFQGIDRLVDVMLGDSFGLCIVAKPLNQESISDLEEQLYSIYNKCSLFANRSIQSGTNDSEARGESTGKNSSITSGTSETKGSTENKSASLSKGENKSSSISTGTSITKGRNSGKSTGKNHSKTAGESEGTNESSGSSSSSKGSNEGKNWSETGGTSETVNYGGSVSKGTTENESISKGKNSSETTSKSKGTSESTGTSKSESFGKNISESKTLTAGSSVSVSTDMADKKVQDYMKYIDELLLPMIDYGKSKGLFINNFFIFSEDKATLIKLGNTITSLCSGKVGNKNSLRVELLNENEENKENNKLIELCKNFQIPKYENSIVSTDKKDALTINSHFINKNYIYNCWYSANELSIVAGLPQKEVVGLNLKKEVEFGLNIENDEIKDKIILGNLIQSGQELEEIKVSLDKKEMNKHIFITGVTGTGKTTTCQRLLLESKLPFLVIEPAKTEYRILLDNKETEDILIFTLGKDTVAPFRLNPFEFFEGESITSRVDMVKSAIEASFDMEAAIPQLIEKSIYECYKDYGWNIAKNTNSKFKNPFAKGVHSFPILSDVLSKVKTVVEKQGFDEKLKNDYIGSIRGRLEGLLQGAKGLMLNTYRGVDFRELIDKKVVLEIENIKNGSEKSLIIGFILTNVYEALKVKYHESLKEGKEKFQHITLVEEAHRLLSKYTAGDSLNKKQGVEVFADLLAEVRKYGESLIIADQIPNKLTPEVLKNTNTKIVHKIFAEDDKDAIGNTMALSGEQKNFLSSLRTGRAVVFSQGWEKPKQVQIELSSNTTGDRYVEDGELIERVMEFYRNNYEDGIFYGSNFFGRMPTKEEFDMIVEFSKYVKINEFIKILEYLDMLENSKKIEIIKKYLENKEEIDELIEETKNKFFKLLGNKEIKKINQIEINGLKELKEKIDVEIISIFSFLSLYGNIYEANEILFEILNNLYEESECEIGNIKKNLINNLI